MCIMPALTVCHSYNAGVLWVVAKVLLCSLCSYAAFEIEYFPIECEKQYANRVVCLNNIKQVKRGQEIMGWEVKRHFVSYIWTCITCRSTYTDHYICKHSLYRSLVCMLWWIITQQNSALHNEMPGNRGTHLHDCCN